MQAIGTLDDEQLRRVRLHLDEDLELLVSRTLSTAQEAIGKEKLAPLCALMHAAALRLDAPKPGMAAWQSDASLLCAAGRDIERWRAVAHTLLTQDDAYRKQLTKNEGFPQKCADKPAMLDLIGEFDREPQVLRVLVEIRSLPEPRYDDEQWGRVREVAHVLVLAAAQLDQVFRDAGAADFPAVSMAALRALERRRLLRI